MCVGGWVAGWLGGRVCARRQLRCERITVHKNLFVSYILTGVVWILYFVLAALDGDVLLANPVGIRHRGTR